MKFDLTKDHIKFEDHKMFVFTWFYYSNSFFNRTLLRLWPIILFYFLHPVLALNKMSSPSASLLRLCFCRFYINVHNRSILKSYILYSECVKKEFHYAFIIRYRNSEIEKRNETNRFFSKID